MGVDEMKDEQAKELFTMIVVAYPNFLNIENKSYTAKNKVDLWKEELLLMDYERTKKKIKQHIRTNPFEPKIADVYAVKEKIKTIDEYEKEMFE